MKLHRLFIVYSVILGIFSASCEEDYRSNAGDTAIPLAVAGKDIKAPGHGQYRLQVQSGNPASITVGLASAEAKSLTITKAINLVTDTGFGNSGVLTVAPGSPGSDYVFNYTPSTTDVDQLVGFTFRAERADGSVVTSDLTLVVTLSPKDNLPRRKWLFKSKIWVDQDNAQDIRECEKDNYYYFNADQTMSIDYGAMSGAGYSGCEYDGLNVYDGWELSADEKTFTMYYHGLFTPENELSEVFRVKTLTTDKLELEIDYDLSWLGLSTEETFIYEYAAQVK